MNKEAKRPRILFLSANPAEMAYLSTGREASEIYERLIRSKAEFEIRTMLAATLPALRNALVEFRPQIVHFSGHGVSAEDNASEGLIFEGTDGRAEFVNGEVLSKYLKFAEVQCVILNACFSAGQASAIAKDVDYVVGIEGQIGDKAAIQFSSAFYDAIGAGQSFEVAFAVGRNALYLASEEDFVPVLLHRKQAVVFRRADERAEGPSAVDLQFQIFLCHASEDKNTVRELHSRLRDDGYNVWLDEEDILPGENWRLAIERALRCSQAVIVCLSKKSVTKTGFYQKEIRIALDLYEEQPPDAIFLIPVKLEACEILGHLNHFQAVTLGEDRSYERLKTSLEKRKRFLAAISNNYRERAPSPL